MREIYTLMYLMAALIVMWTLPSTIEMARAMRHAYVNGDENEKRAVLSSVALIAGPLTVGLIAGVVWLVQYLTGSLR